MPAVQLKKIGLFPHAQAENCVACGLCLAKCPTYLKMLTENESPRGRIALMRALAQGKLAVTKNLEGHLSLCLACRACEQACPSGVGYGELITAARAMIETHRQRPFQERLVRTFILDHLLAQPRQMRLLGKLLRLYQVSGTQRLLRSSGLLKLMGLKKWDSSLPRIESGTKLKTVYPAWQESRGSVALFTGCIAAIVDKTTLTATINVLNHFGYDVHIPSEQTCCGAIHLHAGAPDRAAVLMRKNINAFNAVDTDIIINCVSGCGAMLSEYGKVLPGDTGADGFANKIRDINQFLLDLTWPKDIQLNPLHKRIAVHDPCSLSNVLCQQDKPYGLLKKIPGAEIFHLPDNYLCCGGAGTYHLTQPQMAQRLRQDKLEHLKRLAPDILVTSNVGCAMYLANGIREAGLTIEVVHPVVLLERQLQETNYK